MKVRYNLQQFKRALRRNAYKYIEVLYSGSDPQSANCFYLHTKKSYMFFTPSCRLERVDIYVTAVSLRYRFVKIEDLLNA